jgi:hypothetical protein
MATYTLISSNVLSSSAASVTFSAIPSTYTDLVLRYSGRTDAAATYDFLLLGINGLSTTIYSDTTLYGNGGGASALSTRGTSTTKFRAPRFGLDGSTATASTFSNGEVYIPSYTVSQNKPVSAFSVMENNAADPGYASVAAGLIRETGTITSIELTPLTGPNFVSGSSFYLYGISNA